MRLLKNSLESREEDKLKTLVKKGTDHSVHDHCSTWRQELSSGDRAVCPFFHQRLKRVPPLRSTAAWWDRRFRLSNELLAGARDILFLPKPPSIQRLVGPPRDVNPGAARE